MLQKFLTDYNSMQYRVLTWCILSLSLITLSYGICGLLPSLKLNIISAVLGFNFLVVAATRLDRILRMGPYSKKSQTAEK